MKLFGELCLLWWISLASAAPEGHEDIAAIRRTGHDAQPISPTRRFSFFNRRDTDCSRFFLLTIVSPRNTRSPNSPASSSAPATKSAAALPPAHQATGNAAEPSTTATWRSNAALTGHAVPLDTIVLAASDARRVEEEVVDRRR